MLNPRPGSNQKPEPETRNPKFETRNPKPESRNPKPETQNSKPKPRNPKSENQNSKPQTRNTKPETQRGVGGQAARAAGTSRGALHLGPNPETRNPQLPKSETRNTESDTRNPKPEMRNPQCGMGDSSSISVYLGFPFCRAKALSNPKWTNLYRRRTVST